MFAGGVHEGLAGVLACRSLPASCSYMQLLDAPFKSENQPFQLKRDIEKNNPFQVSGFLKLRAFVAISCPLAMVPFSRAQADRHGRSPATICK
jgi:hypothetical protein